MRATSGPEGAGPARTLGVQSETAFVSHMLDFWIRLWIPWCDGEVGSLAPLDLACVVHSPLSECCGALEYYDKAFDRITTRSEKPLRSIKRIFHTVTTTDDPVIRKVGTPALRAPEGSASVPPLKPQKEQRWGEGLGECVYEPTGSQMPRR